MTQLYDLVLSPTGLKFTQFTTLRIIGDYGAVAQHRLAEAYAISTETLSRRLASLRSKGLIELRTGSPRGEHVYTLTAAGHNALQQALPFWNRAQARLKQTLSDEEWNALLGIANRVTDAARAAERLRSSNVVAVNDEAEARPRRMSKTA